MNKKSIKEEIPFTYKKQICKNCANYNPKEHWNTCLTGLFGNNYPEDHGCYHWKEKI